MKSMTGYGSANGKVRKGAIFAEVRSVNSRFLDINCKIPPRMNVIEPKIKKLIQNSILRGKVDVYLKERAELEQSLELSLNLNLAKQYKKCLTKLKESLGEKSYAYLLEVVDLKDLILFKEKQVEYDKFWPGIERVIRQAIFKFDLMRRREGANLKKDQVKRVVILSKKIVIIKKKVNVWLSGYRSKIMVSMKRNGCSTNSIDQEKLDNEVAIAAGRVDVTEELTRLQSHISQYKGLLAKKGAVGRQLDFIIQEMHREINTLGSKANDSSVSKHVVEFKSEIEKLREQVQNIE